MPKKNELNKQLRDQSLEELQAQYEDLNKKLFELKNQRALNKKSEQPHLFKQTRKDIARVLTVIHRKQA